VSESDSSDNEMNPADSAAELDKKALKKQFKAEKRDKRRLKKELKLAFGH
jgi:hypothetical protein